MIESLKKKMVSKAKKGYKNLTVLTKVYRKKIGRMLIEKIYIQFFKETYPLGWKIFDLSKSRKELLIFIKQKGNTIYNFNNTKDIIKDIKIEKFIELLEKPGVPDLFFYKDSKNWIFVELKKIYKNGKDRLNNNQKKWRDIFYKCVIRYRYHYNITNVI